MQTELALSFLVNCWKSVELNPSDWPMTGQLHLRLFALSLQLGGGKFFYVAGEVGDKA